MFTVSRVAATFICCHSAVFHKSQMGSQLATANSLHMRNGLGQQFCNYRGSSCKLTDCVSQVPNDGTVHFHCDLWKVS